MNFKKKCSNMQTREIKNISWKLQSDDSCLIGGHRAVENFHVKLWKENSEN